MRHSAIFSVAVLAAAVSAVPVRAADVGQMAPPTAAAVAEEAAARQAVQLATEKVQRIEQLVGSGALPRMRLIEAQQDLADAQDDVVLDRTLYSPVAAMTDQTADEMIAAAQRRVERQRDRIRQQQMLAEQGVVARNTVDPLQQELNLRQMGLNLAIDRARLVGELAAMAQSEEAMRTATPSFTERGGTVNGMEHYVGSGRFVESRDLQPIETAFLQRFHMSLPISADGETAVHRALGFDHRGRVDVAVNPNTTAGRWLISYLKSRKIPYYAFSHAMAGRATGAHIHIGPGSTPLLASAD